MGGTWIPIGVRPAPMGFPGPAAASFARPAAVFPVFPAGPAPVRRLSHAPPVPQDPPDPPVPKAFRAIPAPQAPLAPPAPPDRGQAQPVLQDRPELQASRGRPDSPDLREPQGPQAQLAPPDQLGRPDLRELQAQAQPVPPDLQELQASRDRPDPPDLRVPAIASAAPVRSKWSISYSRSSNSIPTTILW